MVAFDETSAWSMTVTSLVTTVGILWVLLSGFIVDRQYPANLRILYKEGDPKAYHSPQQNGRGYGFSFSL